MLTGEQVSALKFSLASFNRSPVTSIPHGLAKRINGKTSVPVFAVYVGRRHSCADDSLIFYCHLFAGFAAQHNQENGLFPWFPSTIAVPAI